MRCVCGAALALSTAWGVAAQPAANLGCEQLFAVAQTAVRYRDQGYSLAQVLGGLKDVQNAGKLTAAELDTLRRAIELAYLGHASPQEIALECTRAQGDAKAEGM